MEENNDTFLAADDVLMYLTEQIHKKYYLLLKCFCVTFLVKKSPFWKSLRKVIYSSSLPSLKNSR